MQSAEQSAEQKPWQIPPKTDGRAYLSARKREAVEAKARELAGEIGGFDNAPAFKMPPRRFPPPWTVEKLDACFPTIKSATALQQDAAADVADGSILLKKGS